MLVQSTYLQSRDLVSKLNATSAPRNNWRSASYLSSKENTYMKTYWHQVGWTDGIRRGRFAPRNVIILYSVLVCTFIQPTVLPYSDLAEVSSCLPGLSNVVGCKNGNCILGSRVRSYTKDIFVHHSLSLSSKQLGCSLACAFCSFAYRPFISQF